MTIVELANFIRKNRAGLNYSGVHPSDDESVVLQYTRHEMCGNVHISSEHIFECRAKANNFEEHVAQCKPIAKVDTGKFICETRHKPVPKGRTNKKALPISRYESGISENLVIFNYLFSPSVFLANPDPGGKRNQLRRVL